jgi:hypothetical protein
MDRGTCGEKHVPGGESGTRQSFISVSFRLKLDTRLPQSGPLPPCMSLYRRICEGQLAPYKTGANLAGQYRVTRFTADWSANNHHDPLVQRPLFLRQKSFQVNRLPKVHHFCLIKFTLFFISLYILFLILIVF